jgi:hypothetical protein
MSAVPFHWKRLIFHESFWAVQEKKLSLQTETRKQYNNVYEIENDG